MEEEFFRGRPLFRGVEDGVDSGNGGGCRCNVSLGVEATASEPFSVDGCVVFLGLPLFFLPALPGVAT